MESIESLGFHLIRVAFDTSTEHPHTMFIKRHSVKTSQNNNTLFAVNVPCYCNETALTNIFQDCGPVSSVHLRERPGSFEDDAPQTKSLILSYIKEERCTFKVAYICFENSDSVGIAMQISSDTVRYMSTEERPVLTGMAKWVKQYRDRYPDPALVQKEADEYMQKFDAEELKKKNELKDAMEPDEEGWVTVPVKKKTPAILKKELKRSKKAEKKMRVEKELQHFYMFQQREAKRDKIATLRQQFEEDKKRIAQMQQQRKFKPFA